MMNKKAEGRNICEGNKITKFICRFKKFTRSLVYPSHKALKALEACLSKFLQKSIFAVLSLFDFYVMDC